MMDKIIAFSIRQKLLIAIGVIGLIGWGIYSLKHLPIGAVPDITDNQVQVITTSPTLAAQEVEKYITYPLEITMSNIPGVNEIRSVSRFGLSVITVVFEENMDIYLARQLISERLQVVKDELPEDMGKPEMGPITTGLGEIYQYVLHLEPGYDSVYNAMNLRTMQDWIVKRQLTGIKGVVEVNSSGGFLKQYEISINPDKIKSLGVTISDIFDAVASNNENTGGSYIEKEHYTYFIRGEGIMKSVSDIEETLVKNVNGTPLLIRDVAEVKMGHAPRFGAVTMNGEGEVVAGQVMMLKGENSAEVTRRVKERIEEIKNTLPEGVILEPYLDRSELVGRTTNTVVTNLVEGGLIVIFILVLLLGNIRAGLIVASVIPLSMLFAISMMRVFGVSANLMSLGAIDFGLIVDGAVIIVESIVHRLNTHFPNQHLTRPQMDKAVNTAASKIRKSAAFGEIIILIVYLPILFLVGVEGKMFRPMAQTVSFAIFGAFLLSLTYVPMMSALVLKRKIKVKRTISDRIIQFFHSLYEPVLKLAMRFKIWVVLLSVLFFLLSLQVFRNMGGEFIPTLEEGDFALHQILPAGSSIKQGVKVSKEIQEILLNEFPEVEKVVTKIGTAEIPTDIMPIEAGDIFVIMKDKSEWTTAKTREEMFEKMEAALNDYPGVMYEFTQPIQMRFNELMTGIRQDIAVKIYGEELGELLKKGQEARDIIQGIDGVGDIQLEQVAGLQQMVVNYKRQNLAKYGLDIDEVNRVIRTAFAGEKAGIIFEGERRFDVVVRLDTSYRQNIDQLRDLYIPLPGGSQVPLHELADVNFKEGPSQISRDDTKRRITIGVNARNRDVESLVNEIKRELNNRLTLDEGYYIRYGGQFENLEKASARLAIAVPVALALIFLLLYITFNSVLQALLIFTAVPLSAIGGVFALYLRDMPFSISAGVGFIALFGVAVLNGIVLIGYFNELKEDGVADLKKRIFQGTSVRLRPVLMTASVASLGFLPMAISTTAGAEVQRPLATVVIGGLITATMLTMILLPILYYYTEKYLVNDTGKAGPSKTAVITIVLLVASVLPLNSQQEFRGLDSLMHKAMENHPSLQQSRLNVSEKKALEEGIQKLPLGNIGYAREEFDPETGNGIESVIVGQNFYWPGSNKIKSRAAGQATRLAETKYQLEEAELRRNVRQSYIQVLHWKQIEQLTGESLRQLDRYREIARQRFELGEAGKLPWLAMENARRDRLLELQRYSGEKDAALQQLSFWTGAQVEEIPDTLFPQITPATRDASLNPVLMGFYWEKQQLAVEQKALKKLKYRPQITTAARLQAVAGEWPFYGFQIGLTAPVFGTGQRAQMQAAELNIRKAGAQAQEKRLAWESQLEQARIRQEKVGEQISTLEEEILPSARQQVNLSGEGFRLGELTYLEALNAVEHHYEKQSELLEARYMWHQLEAEILYLTGKQ